MLRGLKVRLEVYNKNVVSSNDYLGMHPRR